MQELRHTALEMTKSQNDSIGEVIQDNGKRLFDFIRNRVREEEEAEDIFQDVMIELTQSYRMMQPIEKMAAWLFRVARNKITDNYRKKRPVLLDDQFSYRGNDEDEPLYIQDLIKSSEKSPDSDFDRALIYDAIEMALEELPAEQRDVFVKHELEGKSFKEMAEETGLSQNTLLSRKRYAVMALRDKLQFLYTELMEGKNY
ncbi:MAG: RNA polymerase sigma factor [Bacteroidota bacterium]